MSKFKIGSWCSPVPANGLPTLANELLSFHPTEQEFKYADRLAIVQNDETRVILKNEVFGIEKTRNASSDDFAFYRAGDRTNAGHFDFTDERLDITLFCKLVAVREAAF
jgi:hypothetical protein